MSKIKLNSQSIKAAQPGEHRDHIARGLYLRVSPKGFRSWAVLARGPDSKLKRLTIGPLAAYSLADARERAPELLKAIKEGRDPRAEAWEHMRARDARVTFSDAAEQYIEQELPHLDRVPRYKAGIASCLRMAGAEMGVADWTLEDIGTTQLIGLIDLHMKPRTGKPSPSAARTRLQAISNLYEWCVERELVADNPVHWLPKKRRPAPPPSREYVIPMGDLHKIWKIADTLGEPLSGYVKCWALLPLRRTELSHLRWNDIDLEAGRIRLSGSATKNREPFQIPLNAAASSILEARKEAATSEFVFPSNRKVVVPIHGWGAYKKKVQKVSGTDYWRWHDLRRSFVSELAERGFDIDLVDGLLNHAQSGTRGGVLGTYQRSTRWGDKVQAMEAWADAVTGRDQGQVIELRAGK